MRVPPLVLLCACGTLAAHGIDTPTDCADGDTDCVEPIDGTPVPSPTEDCGNGADDDGDGGADCGDPDCLSICDADGDGDFGEALGGDDCDDGDPTVYPGADDPCDGFDSDCDQQDCDGWTDDFESPVGPEWRASGGAPWNLHFMGGALAHEGSYSGQSGNIADNQLTTVAVTVTFTGPGTISFWHTGSTEDGFDFLRFYVGGVLQEERSGVWNWTNSTWPTTAGTVDLEWTYSKDVSLDGGTDTVWIDLVEITGGSP